MIEQFIYTELKLNELNKKKGLLRERLNGYDFYLATDGIMQNLVDLEEQYLPILKYSLGELKKDLYSIWITRFDDSRFIIGSRVISLASRQYNYIHGLIIPSDFLRKHRDQLSNIIWIIKNNYLTWNISEAEKITNFETIDEGNIVSQLNSIKTTILTKKQLIEFDKYFDDFDVNQKYKILLSGNYSEQSEKGMTLLYYLLEKYGYYIIEKGIISFLADKIDISRYETVILAKQVEKQFSTNLYTVKDISGKDIPGIKHKTNASPAVKRKVNTNPAVKRKVSSPNIRKYSAIAAAVLVIGIVAYSLRSLPLNLLSKGETETATESQNLSSDNAEDVITVTQNINTDNQNLTTQNQHITPENTDIGTNTGASTDDNDITIESQDIPQNIQDEHIETTVEPNENQVEIIENPVEVINTNTNINTNTQPKSTSNITESPNTRRETPITKTESSGTIAESNDTVDKPSVKQTTASTGNQDRVKELNEQLTAINKELEYSTNAINDVKPSDPDSKKRSSALVNKITELEAERDKTLSELNKISE